MDIIFKHYKWFYDGWTIAHDPWFKALQQSKAGINTSIDNITASRCNNRQSYKLQSIGSEGRSAKDAESWSQVLQHSEK